MQSAKGGAGTQPLNHKNGQYDKIAQIYILENILMTLDKLS